MTIERFFLGWDEPVVTKVRRHLLGDGPSEPNALAGLLLLVPTQQSGRRLRLAMARHAALHGTHVGFLRPRLPIDLVRSGGDDMPVATPLECGAAWARLLLDSDFAALTSLFPAHDTTRGFGWALATGKLVQSLRQELAASGLTIGKVVAERLNDLEEPDRWADMARLELHYLDLLAANNRTDPAESRIAQSLTPRVPPGTERIVLACAPDPDPIALEALQRLSADLPVQVLVHAPESIADRFDDWGRPLVASWQQTPIEIPDAASNIRLADTPAGQARTLVELLREDHYGAADIGVGVPDTDVVPFLSAELSRQGVEPFDPNGVPLHSHPLFALVEAYRGLLQDGTYESLAAFLRHPDILAALNARAAVPPRALLTQLDEFQNAHLPAEVRDVRSRLRRDATYSVLASAISNVDEITQSKANDGPAASLRSFLETVFAHRRLSTENHADSDFATVAQLLSDVLSEYEDCCAASFSLEDADARTLLVEHLRSLRYQVPRHGAEIDLEGWLELHWNEAPCLVVTGMNEGRVPESITSDAFLPNSLRKRLGLRCDDDRLARDLYLMQAMVECRRAEGRTSFICGKTGSSGDPLRPSRLLFACNDSELPTRARRLFGPPESHLVNYPASTSFLLRPSPPADIGHRGPDLTRLAVTGFRDYLACPFRFYLKRVLGMESLDDRKREMDAMAFGSLLHEVLSRMAKDQSLRNTTNTSELTAFLHDEAGKWMADQYGNPLPLNLQMQLSAARERLAAIARVQAAEAADGWEIVLAEHPVETTIGAITVHGQIDRVDRNSATGEIRVLDYKTSDRGDGPETEHLRPPKENTPEYAIARANGRDDRAWKDLQLPLYAILLREQGNELAGATPGYFTIPGAVDETAVKIWDTFTPELLKSAEICAAGIARDIAARRFWPPSPRVNNDDFEVLFSASLESSVDFESFREYMEGRQ